MDTFTVEFHRRLERLYDALSYYFETGRVGNQEVFVLDNPDLSYV